MTRTTVLPPVSTQFSTPGLGTMDSLKAPLKTSNGQTSSSQNQPSPQARLETCGSFPRTRRIRISPTSSSTSLLVHKSRRSLGIPEAFPWPPTPPSLPTQRASPSCPTSKPSLTETAWRSTPTGQRQASMTNSTRVYKTWSTEPKHPAQYSISSVRSIKRANPGSNKDVLVGKNFPTNTLSVSTLTRKLSRGHGDWSQRQGEPVVRGTPSTPRGEPPAALRDIRYRVAIIPQNREPSTGACRLLVLPRPRLCAPDSHRYHSPLLEYLSKFHLLSRDSTARLDWPGKLAASGE